MPTIKALSFDLWDTILVDGSDEPKRKAQGLPSKKESRRQLVYQALSKFGPVDRALLTTAYDTADAAFTRVWQELAVTWTVRQRLEVVLAGMQRTLPEEVLSELVREHQEMELKVRPDMVAGAKDAVALLGMRYRLVAIADCHFTPGWAVKKLLEGYGLLEFFAGLVFSDECGHAKPSPEVFTRAAELAGCDLKDMLHIGDREHNDVSGAQGVGARAILFTAAVDRGSSTTKAAAVCKSYRELPAIIAALERR